MTQREFNQTLLSLKPSMEAYIKAHMHKYFNLSYADPDEIIQNCFYTCMTVKEKAEREAENLERYLFGVVKKSLQKQNSTIMDERKNMEVARELIKPCSRFYTDGFKNIEYITSRVKNIKAKNKREEERRKTMIAVWDSLLLSDGNMAVASRITGKSHTTVRKYREQIRKIYEESLIF